MNRIILPLDDEDARSPTIEEMIERARAERERKEGRQNGTPEPTYEADDELLLATYLKWLDKQYPYETIDAYDLARKRLRGTTTAPAQAHVLLMNPRAQQHPRYKCSGIFLSALYETTPDETISYELNTPRIDWIGYRTRNILSNSGTIGNAFGWESSAVINNNGTTEDNLGRWSTGVINNNGTTGHRLGMESSGLIINNGTTRDWLGWSSTGIIINNGMTGECCGKFASGLFIALTEPQHWGHAPDATILRPDDLNPTLKDYIDRLVTASKEQPETITQEFGSTKRIKNKIYQLAEVRR